MGPLRGETRSHANSRIFEKLKFENLFFWNSTISWITNENYVFDIFSESMYVGGVGGQNLWKGLLLGTMQFILFGVGRFTALLGSALANHGLSIGAPQLSKLLRCIANSAVGKVSCPCTATQTAGSTPPKTRSCFTAFVRPIPKSKYLASP